MPQILLQDTIEEESCKDIDKSCKDIIFAISGL